MKGCFENRYAYFRIGNGIVFIETKHDVVLDLEMAIAITTSRISVQKQRRMSVFFEMSGVVDCDKQGRDFLAKFGWGLTQRVAIQAKSHRSFMVAKYYDKISKPVVATHVFMDETEAYHFLNLK